MFVGLSSFTIRLSLLPDGNSYAHASINYEKGLWARSKHLNESFKLVKSQMQFLEALTEQVPQSVLVHDIHQHTECLFLRHLNKRTMQI